jgi:hypothetical protein
MNVRSPANCLLPLCGGVTGRIVRSCLAVLLTVLPIALPAAENLPDFHGQDLEQFKPYYPIYRRYNLGFRKSIFLTDHVRGKRYKIYFSMEDGHRPLGFVEARGGMYFVTSGNQEVRVYWLDAASFNIEERKTCKIPGTPLLHDGLTLGKGKTYGGDRSWIFSFLSLYNSEFEVRTCSSISDENLTLRRSPNQPVAMYLQYLPRAREDARLRLHVLEKDLAGRFLHVERSRTSEQAVVLKEKRIDSARFFDTGGAVTVLYVNSQRSAWLEKDGRKIQIVRHPALKDVRDIRVGVFQINKKVMVEFYFSPLWGNIYKTGKISLSSIQRGFVQTPSLNMIWSPPASALMFGYYRKQPGFFLSFGNRQQSFLPYGGSAVRVTNVSTAVKAEKKVSVKIKWNFSSPIRGRIAYSYGLSRGVGFNFPDPFYRTDRKSVDLVVENPGLRFFHLRGTPGTGQKITDLHIPVPIYYRLPPVVLENPQARLSDGLYYFRNENISFRIKGSGQSNYIYRYLLSPKRKKGLTAAKLKGIVDTNLPILNFRLDKPGRYYLYLAAFYDNGRLTSDVREVEIWTEGNRLTSVKGFRELESLRRELNTLLSILSEAGPGLTAARKKAILKRARDVEKKILARRP